MRGQQQRQGGGLSCVVVNVNGLSDPVKRRTLFKRLLQMQVDVAVLCETHSTSDEQVRGWVQDGAGPGRPWQGHAFWTHGADRSRGVAVLLDSKVVQGQPTVSYQGGEGRLLGVTFTGVTGTKWEVLGVYAPVEPPNRDAFFAGPFTAACAAKDPAAMLLVFFFHLGYMGFAPDNLPDSDAMRLRACIHSTPHMQARHTTANTCTCTNT
jgi:hypothetical protein